MNRMSALSAALLAIVTPIALAGCTFEAPAAVKQKADAPANVVETEASKPESSEPETSAPSMPKLGDLVTVGDWDVKITKVVLDAEAQMRAANQFNDRPKGQYVLVTYEATYTGPERTADAWMDLTWSFTTTDSQVNEPASGVTPADNEEWPSEARSGGTVRGQEVWDLPKKLIKGGILTVEGYDEGFNTVYADFAL
jgi:hypothetical protein